VSQRIAAVSVVVPDYDEAISYNRWDLIERA
jgi:hypothetical protein